MLAVKVVSLPVMSPVKVVRHTTGEDASYLILRNNKKYKGD